MADWDFADAWFATSIAEFREPQTPHELSEVIAVADFLEHSIPTRAEIEQAVSRLLGAGLLAVDTTRFALTPAGESLLAQHKGRGTKAIESVAALLATMPVTPVAWTISDDEVSAAYARYLAR